MGCTGRGLAKIPDKKSADRSRAAGAKGGTSDGGLQHRPKLAKNPDKKIAPTAVERWTRRVQLRATAEAPPRLTEQNFWSPRWGGRTGTLTLILTLEVGALRATGDGRARATPS